MERTAPERSGMFLSRHDHSLDSKGRITLPAEFRSEFGEAAILSPVLDGCVAIWTKSEFEQRAQEMLEKARRGQVERNMARSFAAAAKEVGIDSHGRLVIPPNLRDYAQLDRDVAVIGALNHVEVWNPERWAAIDDTSTGHMRNADIETVSDMSF